jgi:DNA polymerase-3 subunit alpha
MVLVKLGIQQGFDGVSINVRVSSIEPLQQMRKNAIKKAVIQLSSQLDIDAKALTRQQQLLQRLQDMIKNNPGTTPLALELAFEKAQVRIKPERLGIDLNDTVCQSLFSLKREGVSLHYA